MFFFTFKKNNLSDILKYIKKRISMSQMVFSWGNYGNPFYLSIDILF